MVEEHLRALLKLPAERRAHAAKLLLDSLDEDGDDLEAEALRNAEVVRRARAVIDGSADTLSAEEVRDRIDARLRQVREQ
jgi:putative addiction module component (TIGR02574 family)